MRMDKDGDRNGNNLISAKIRRIIELNGIDIGNFKTQAVDSKKDAVTIENNTILVIRPGLKIDIRSSEKNIVLVIAKEATVRYLTVSDGTNKKFAIVDDDAEIVWIDAIIGGQSRETSCENYAILAGTGAKAKMSSVFLGTDVENYSIKTGVTHMADRTSSNMLTRAVLMDESRGKYEGTIRIDQNAKGCEAHQREDTLLLGDKSSMDAKPVLEIENNDVKCGHGVALGKIDDEKLFYLESRGISRKQAELVIVEGFFEPLLISMGEHGKDVRNDITSKLEKRLGHN